MRVRFDDRLILWAIGVLQPVRVQSAVRFLHSVFPEAETLAPERHVFEVVDRWIDGGQVVRVRGWTDLSLSAAGNHLMGVELRRQRDRARLFLLKSARAARSFSSEDVPTGLTGASPVVDGSSATQGARPISTVDVPLRDALTALNVGRAYWPRVVKQLQVGPHGTSSEVSLSLYSFASHDAVHQASDRPGKGEDLSITDIGLAIGVSPRLLTSFMHRPANHYREFEIGKRGGGVRRISSPRIFLKVVQYWLLDYLLFGLPQHPASHAYQRGRSIVTNAMGHVGKRFVAGIDIESFFPSLSPESIAKMLKRSGFGAESAKAVAWLTTLNNGLPQGAPTSPALSNAFLFRFDQELYRYCLARGIAYSRYADDITISGDDRHSLELAIRKAQKELLSLGLAVNPEKTRIASRGGQQRVAGVVVNEKAQPPRALRRTVRAMVHRAEQGQLSGEQLASLRGYLAYFNSYPTLRDTPKMMRYRLAVKGL